MFPYSNEYSVFKPKLKNLIEYRTIPWAPTTNLSFWLSCSKNRFVLYQCQSMLFKFFIYLKRPSWICLTNSRIQHFHMYPYHKGIRTIEPKKQILIHIIEIIHFNSSILIGFFSSIAKSKLSHVFEPRLSTNLGYSHYSFQLKYPSQIY